MFDHLEVVISRPLHSGEKPGYPACQAQRRQLVQQSVQAVRMGSDPRFVKLRKRFIRQFAVLAVLFLGLYLGYIFLTAFARDFMAVRVAGSINVALILGVLQFASTFLLAWGYGRCAARGLDPLAAELRIEKAEESAARHGRVVRP